MSDELPSTREDGVWIHVIPAFRAGLSDRVSTVGLSEVDSFQRPFVFSTAFAAAVYRLTRRHRRAPVWVDDRGDRGRGRWLVEYLREHYRIDARLRP